MNIAIVGKGGSGKTSISGTMARVLARRGHSVLAVDGDPNPNMAITLGIPVEHVNDLPTLPRDLANWSEGKCNPRMSLDEVRDSYGVEGKDGVGLLVMVNPQKAGTG